MFRIPLIAILFGYFVQNLLIFDTATTYLMLFLVVGVGIGLSTKSWDFEIPEKHEIYKKISAGLVIVLSLVSIVLFVILPWRESKKLRVFFFTNNLVNLVPSNQYLQKTSLFGGVNDSATLATLFYASALSNFSKIENNKANTDTTLNIIDFLVTQMKKDMESQPFHFRSYMEMRNLLNLRIVVKGESVEDTTDYSNSILEKALLLNSENPDIYIVFAEKYIVKKDFKKARLYIRQAIVTAPDYLSSYQVAKKIQISSPDWKFKKFVDQMEQRWILD
jgi:hypothetical protein